MEFYESRLPMMTCCACGYKVDATTQVTADEEKRSPEDGDCSLCLACVSLNVFCNNVTALRPPTADELADMYAQPEIQAMSAAILNLKEKDPEWPTKIKKDMP